LSGNGQFKKAALSIFMKKDKAPLELHGIFYGMEGCRFSTPSCAYSELRIAKIPLRVLQIVTPAFVLLDANRNPAIPDLKAPPQNNRHTNPFKKTLNGEAVKPD
jgi:hypothetical protein